jgi:uncharacterized protein YbbC (DUF1343 family)
MLLGFSLMMAGILTLPACAQTAEPETGLICGAQRTALYLPLLEGKRVGVVANQTSVIGSAHLVDSLMALGVNIIKVFSPEHGFRGNAAAGEKVGNSIDSRSGLPIVSLYGNNRKPPASSLIDIDIVLFDIQDVGVRFYTYISTLHLVMEACAEAGKPLLLLDRPNPNGFYVDGPMIDSLHMSFVGMHRIPVVHGMSLGEYAMMINGESWLNNAITCDLSVVPMLNWDHNSRFSPPIPPSPNLNTAESILLYPTLCLFEGTVLSVGRGTDRPFTMIGHPQLKTGDYFFTPSPRPGAAPKPLLQDQSCRGIDFLDSALVVNNQGRLMIEWVILAYQNYPEPEKFFQPFFLKLVGSAGVQADIKAGRSAAEIRAGWQPDLQKFLLIREKYLLYDDSVEIRAMKESD